MSLSIAFAQIQTPSFWHQLCPPGNKTVKQREASEEIRRKLLQTIQDAGGPIGFEVLAEQTGLKPQTISNLLRPLVDDRKVRRIKGDSGRMFVESSHKEAA